MKKHIRVGLMMSLVMLGLGIAPRAIRAGVPHTLTQQGRLFDESGTTITGTKDVTFAIYDKESAGGGSALWTETQSITFEDGWFSVALGDVQPIADGVLTGESRWLGIKVDVDNEMSPRAAIRSVPYAWIADTAENVTGDITPKSVSIAGIGKVIDENGKWVGDTTGLVGPQGPEGPVGPAGPAGAQGPEGPGVVTAIYTAKQSSPLTTIGSNWLDVPGAFVNFSVTGNSVLELDANGGATGSGSMQSPDVHCGMRFVVDGQPQGSQDWGDVILGCAVNSFVGGGGWHCPWYMSRSIALAAGAHSVRLQQTGSPGAGCYAGSEDHYAARLRVWVH